jgi:endonuclease/exonuclease/phosphatase family metal-dependent hydrolase
LFFSLIFLPSKLSHARFLSSFSCQFPLGKIKMQPSHQALIGLSTFNIRNTIDRYPERKQFLLATASELIECLPGPHIMGLQEVAFDETGRSLNNGAGDGVHHEPAPTLSSHPFSHPPSHSSSSPSLTLSTRSFSSSASLHEKFGQSFDIARTVHTLLHSTVSDTHVFNSPTRSKFPPWHPTFRIDGNATLVVNKPQGPRLVVEQHDTLHISDLRSAQRLLIRVEQEVEGVMLSARMWFVNTHLHHELLPHDAIIREDQVRAVLQWMDASGTAQCPDVVFVGDFNAPPHEPAYALLTQHGYRSAYASIHGAEPPFTFPTGLQAPTMDTDPPLTTDYIFSNSSLVTFLSAELRGNKSLPSDPTIYPSDHMAVVSGVRIELSSSLSA